MLNIPIKFDDLLKIVDTLSPEQRRLLQEHIEIVNNIPEADLNKPRILGLHMNAMSTTEDFDAPIEL